MALRRRTTKGFTRSGQLLANQIRAVGQSRGFAVSRVLTDWPEIAGPEVARYARPVKVTYPRAPQSKGQLNQGPINATLVVLVQGAYAPMLEMQKEALRTRINACYGYAAIGKIALTQTAPTGFAEGQADFTPAPKRQKPKAADPKTKHAAQSAARPIQDAGLRAALERLGENVLSKSRP